MRPGAARRPADAAGFARKRRSEIGSDACVPMRIFASEKGQALTRTARSNPDLARGRDQGFGQACVPSLNSGVQCGAADLSKRAAAP